MFSVLAGAGRSHARSRLWKGCVSQNTPFESLPFLTRAKLPVAASQAAPTPLPASPGHRQTPLAWAEGTELPETPAIQMKGTQEKRHKASLAKPQLSGSEQGKKVGTAQRSRAQLDQRERSLRSMQPEPCEHSTASLLLPSWLLLTHCSDAGTTPASPGACGGGTSFDLCPAAGGARSGHGSPLPAMRCRVTAGQDFTFLPPLPLLITVAPSKPSHHQARSSCICLSCSVFTP